MLPKFDPPSEGITDVNPGNIAPKITPKNPVVKIEIITANLLSLLFKECNTKTNIIPNNDSNTVG